MAWHSGSRCWSARGPGFKSRGNHSVCIPYFQGDGGYEAFCLKLYVLNKQFIVSRILNYCKNNLLCFTHAGRSLLQSKYPEVVIEKA